MLNRFGCYFHPIDMTFMSKLHTPLSTGHTKIVMKVKRASPQFRVACHIKR
jgi:hypothetical protein